MKTITRTFYVSDTEFSKLQKQKTLNTYLNNHPTIEYKNEIQISWQEPEKKIEISESEFDVAIKSLKEKTQWQTYLNIVEKELKQKLFGANDE